MIDTIMLWLGNMLILTGAFFVLTGALGMLRMPDFFSRLHPAGVTDSLGIPCVLLGLMLHAGLTLVSGKLLLLMLFLLIASPTACHALAKAAFLSGMEEEEVRALKKAKPGEPVKNTPAAEKPSAKKGGAKP